MQADQRLLYFAYGINTFSHDMAHVYHPMLQFCKQACSVQVLTVNKGADTEGLQGVLDLVPTLTTLPF